MICYISIIYNWQVKKMKLFLSTAWKRTRSAEVQRLSFLTLALDVSCQKPRPGSLYPMVSTLVPTCWVPEAVWAVLERITFLAHAKVWTADRPVGSESFHRLIYLRCFITNKARSERAQVDTLVRSVYLRYREALGEKTSIEKDLYPGEIHNFKSWTEIKYPTKKKTTKLAPYNTEY